MRDILHSKKNWISRKQKIIASRPKCSVPPIFAKWFRNDAREMITERLERYSRQTGIRYNKVKITSAQSRWGSCTSRGNLNFSWRVMTLPLEVVDYVVVHELMHIVEMNHSKRFWSKVAGVLPDYKERRKRLRGF
ncbi:MAG: M48 family metallopeptidase [Candidatus Margulisbacteria bacterium]|nr:M48 family metallopeptidase [Candidatus Margulisiibacteriota bacterium]